LVSTEIVIGLPEGTHVRVVTGNGLEIGMYCSISLFIGIIKKLSV